MSQFEYLSRFSISPLPSGSTLHQLDPRSRLLGFTLLLLALTLSSRLAALAAGLVLVLLLLKAAGVPLSYALRGLRAPLPFIIILALLQLLIAGSESDVLFSWKFLSITLAGVRAGALLIIRFLDLILLLTLASAALSTLELIYGLDLLLKPLRRIGIRTQTVSMMVQIMLRFIPFLLLNAEKIARSQASRGAVWGSSKGGLLQRVRQVVPLLVPLFGVSLQQADTLAQAMLARAYGSKAERTGLREYRFEARDLAFVVLCAASSVMLLI